MWTANTGPWCLPLAVAAPAIETSLALIHDFRHIANVSALTGLLR